MSRFNNDYDGDGIPWGLWEAIVRNALAGRRGQQALADLEQVLLALPERKLIEGHLVNDNMVCVVGAYVAGKKAADQGIPLDQALAQMSDAVHCGSLSCQHRRDEHDADGRCTGTRMDWLTKATGPCPCTGYQADDFESDVDTVAAGEAAGLTMSVAHHLGYLNDEEMRGKSPEERWRLMFEFVRRAQGKSEMVPA